MSRDNFFAYTVSSDITSVEFLMLNLWEKVCVEKSLVDTDPFYLF